MRSPTITWYDMLELLFVRRVANLLNTYDYVDRTQRKLFFTDVTHSSIIMRELKIAASACFPTCFASARPRQKITQFLTRSALRSLSERINVTKVP